MSYLVFARKYRPLVFDDVVGQQHVTQTLAKAIEKDRVAHAYIFSGTRGVGKTTTARILARALNCDKGPTPIPCGECNSCKQITAGASLDVLEIDGASNNGVDDIRELRDNIGYGSMAGKYRIFVIDEVHMLTKPAFNALLKTLEEPPPKVIFIFATTEPNKIPATIHSRCQRYDFRRISPEQLQLQLEKICKAEGVAFEPESLTLVARKADGSMRDALSILDQVYSYCQGEAIQTTQVRAVLGVVGSESYGRILTAVRAREAAPVLEAVRDVLMHGYDLHEFLVGLEEYIRDLVLVHISAAPESVPAAVREQAKQFTEADLLRMADAVRRTENELRNSAYPRFLVEALLLKLVHMDDTVSLEQLLRLVGSGGTETLVPSTAPAPDSGEQSKKKALIADLPQAAAPHEPAAQPQPPVAVTPVPTSAPMPELSVTQTVEPSTSEEPSQQYVEPAAPGAASVEEPLPEEYDSSDMPEDDDDIEYGPGAVAPEPARKPSAGRDMQADWQRFLEQFHEDRPTLSAFLANARIAAWTGASLDLQYAPTMKFQFDEVTQKGNREIIEKKIAEFAGTPIQVHITIDAGQAPETAAIETHVRKNAAAAIEDDIQNEPIIKTVLEVFDGEVIE